MKHTLLLIRHAPALEREEWRGEDLQRPLSEEGKRVARDFFRSVAPLYPDLQVIFSSKAIRALETAQILQEAFLGTSVTRDERLNPGSTIAAFLPDLLKSSEGPLALVGHEPDLSSLLGTLICGGEISIKVKKPSLIELSLERGRSACTVRGELRGYLTPKAMRA